VPKYCDTKITFFCEADYRLYIELIAEAKATAGVEIWAYCLMPNHVHFIVVPQHEDSLAKLFRSAHRKYTRLINFREGWRGHLWQERFHSSVMDEQYLLTSTRYTELNPVRARLCGHAEQWAWSSVHAHLRGEDDELVNVRPMLELVGDWRGYLRVEDSLETVAEIRQHARTGRPMGSTSFLDTLEKLTGRRLHKGKPGPKLEN